MTQADLRSSPLRKLAGRLRLRRLLVLLALLLLPAACSAPATPSGEGSRDPGGSAGGSSARPADEGAAGDAGAERAPNRADLAEARDEGDARGSGAEALAGAADLERGAALEGEASGEVDAPGSEPAAIETIRAAAARPPAELPAIELPAGLDAAELVLEARARVDAGDPRDARQRLEALARSASPVAASDARADGDPSPGSESAAASAQAAAGGTAPTGRASEGPSEPGLPAWLRATLDGLPPAGRYVYGLALEAEGAHQAAAEAYESFGQAQPVMADVAWMAVGNARFAAGEGRAAAEAFTRARDLALEPGSAYLAALRLGNARLRAGETAAALSAYLDAEARAQADESRAQALAGQIAARLALGERAAAMDTRRLLIRELSGTSLAGAALARLQEAGERVTPEEEALVRAGQGEHWQALALLEQAIDDRREAGLEIPSTWQRDQATWYAAVGEQERVVTLSETFLRERPADALAPELAWLRARALDRAGRDAEAAEGYLLVAESWPEGARAADALWQRAWLLAAIQDPATAATAFERMAVRQPDDARAAEARFQAGLALWQAGDDLGAAERWTALARAGSSEAERARGAYWLGRSRWDAGDPAGAHEAWRLAAETAPEAFYGLRARARLERVEALLLALPAPTASTEPEAELTAWLAGWTGPVDPAASRAELSGRREMERTEAWLAIGEPRAARREGRRVLTALARDPVALVALAERAADLGLTDLAISAASSAIRQAPAGARAEAPRWLWRLAYPSGPEAELLAAAAERALPPTLLLALVRQESRFDPGARSPAGALGLTQVMPATGRQVATWLGEPGFAPADLLEPRTALRFGAAYLEAQLDRFDGRVWPALAAYNGGPGNAERWWATAGGDIDRFAEIIDFSETRSYVRLVAEHRAHYQRLYPELD